VEACERSRNVREWARRLQLAPGIEAGRRFVALAEKHVGDFWDLVSGYDREGSFPVENFADLTASRAIAATVPAEAGGLGLTSLYDTISSCWTRCGRPRCADRRLAGGVQHLPPPPVAALPHAGGVRPPVEEENEARVSHRVDR
jgi:hypothetical protein